MGSLLKREALHRRWRIAVALLANLALAFSFFRTREHLWNIRDFRYAPVNMTFAFLLAAVPTVVVLLLIPVIARGRTPQRWIGMALVILPGYLALAGWMQLLLVAVSTR
jgi:hypothetical protein